MPHIVIEYSQNSLQFSDEKRMLKSAFEAVKLAGLFTLDNIKVRLHPVEQYQLALPDYGFIHVMCRMHIGKTSAQKQQLTQHILDAISLLAEKKTVITVEVVEMARDSYAKRIVP